MAGQVKGMNTKMLFCLYTCGHIVRVSGGCLGSAGELLAPGTVQLSCTNVLTSHMHIPSAGSGCRSTSCLWLTNVGLCAAALVHVGTSWTHALHFVHTLQQVRASVSNCHANPCKINLNVIYQKELTMLGQQVQRAIELLICDRQCCCRPSAAEKRVSSTVLCSC